MEDRLAKTAARRERAEGVQWRTAEHGIPPPAALLSSPCGTDAHLAETCDEGKPHPITHVQTMAVPDHGGTGGR